MKIKTNYGITNLYCSFADWKDVGLSNELLDWLQKEFSSEISYITAHRAFRNLYQLSSLFDSTLNIWSINETNIVNVSSRISHEYCPYMSSAPEYCYFPEQSEVVLVSNGKDAKLLEAAIVDFLSISTDIQDYPQVWRKWFKITEKNKKVFDSQYVEIVNKLGLHARASSVLVSLASKFISDIYLYGHGYVVNGKSIMGVMMLSMNQGGKLGIIASGDDSDIAVNALSVLINDKFGEEQ